jgi:hypothetical protein
VGDYSRRLARKLQDLGHSVQLIALNDQVEKDCHELQDSVPAMRLPSTMEWDERIAVARKQLQDFQPDWIALQYVCYGFHPKGLAWYWNEAFRQICSGFSNRHLMMHELWIGEGGYSPLRHRLMGKLQRWTIKELSRNFQPKVVTTTVPSFQRRLSRIGITSSLLPLFGNIPIAARNNERICRMIQEGGSKICQNGRDTFLNGIVFGTVHPDFDVKPLIKWLVKLQKGSGKPIVLTMIGRLGAGGGKFVRQLKASTVAASEVIDMKEWPEEIISQALQFADFGINTGSAEFLGKSGTFAAMREHGLPVVVAEGELDASFKNSSPPVWQLSESNPAIPLKSDQGLLKTKSGVARTADELLNYLINAAAA